MYEMGVSRQNGGPRSLRLPITQGYVPERQFHLVETFLVSGGISAHHS